MNKIGCLLLIIMLLFCVLGCGSTSIDSNHPRVEIRILKIGKADTILINTGTHAVVIDTGEAEDGLEILDALKQMGINSIDKLIITHFDKDHVGGADDILHSISVKQVIDPDYEKDSTQYREYRMALADRDTDRIRLSERMTFTYDDVSFTVYPAKETYYNNDNDYSLVVSMGCGDTSFLFAADSDEARLSELLLIPIGQHDFLKVPYHGNWIKNADAFFSNVQPQYAVITCSDKNPPDDRIVDLLINKGANVYETRNGDVRIYSDGNTIQLAQ